MALLKSTFVTGIRDENVKLSVESRNANIGLAKLFEAAKTEDRAERNE